MVKLLPSFRLPFRLPSPACLLFALIIVYVRFSYPLKHHLPTIPSAFPWPYVCVCVCVLLDAVYGGPSFILFFILFFLFSSFFFLFSVGPPFAFTLRGSFSDCLLLYRPTLHCPPCGVRKGVPVKFPLSPASGTATPLLITLSILPSLATTLPSCHNCPLFLYYTDQLRPLSTAHCDTPLCIHPFLQKSR